MRVELAERHDRLGYFAWALEEWPQAQPILTLIDLPEVNSDSIIGWLERAVASIFPITDPHKDEAAQAEVSVRYIAVAGLWAEEKTRSATGILSQSERHFAADDSVDTRIKANLEDAAFQLLLPSVMGVLAGNRSALTWLAVLLLRGPINRQLMIARFLDTATRGQVGLQETAIPTQDQVLQWVGVIEGRGVELRSSLKELLGEYIELPRKGRLR